MDKKFQLPNGDIRTVSPQEIDQFLIDNEGAIELADDVVIPSQTDLSEENQTTNIDENLISEDDNLVDTNIEKTRTIDEYLADLNEEDFGISEEYTYKYTEEDGTVVDLNWEDMRLLNLPGWRKRKRHQRQIALLRYEEQQKKFAQAELETRENNNIIKIKYT